MPVHFLSCECEDTNTPLWFLNEIIPTFIALFFVKLSGKTRSF
ncbi:hypothetical protein PsAD37_03342 [Pseudovibrio sp. Ad37]|nr:hypothetical protein PsAD37_03342 [Pseudovibrio sp. Ad37]